MRRLFPVLAAALAVAGCKKTEGPVVAAPTTAPAQAAAQPAATLQGKVLERIDAPPYSYLRIETAAGEKWAAVTQTKLDKGDSVAVGNGLEMKNYTSQTLKRTFETVYFGSVVEGGAGAQAAGNGQMPPGHPDTSGKPAAPGAGGPMGGGMDMASQHAAAAAGPADVGDVKVAKASGSDARTVAEIHAQRAALKEKPVTLKGKVVKSNSGIMGRNWLHLRDGSGSADAKDNDITVTTGDSAAVGDVVVVKGTVRVDKDFGMGYQYPVIIEDAKLSK